MSPIRRRPGEPIYTNLRVLRAEREMSRLDLAELIGVNLQTIGAVERGDHYPSLDLAFRICDVFGLTVEEVFSRVPFTPRGSSLQKDTKTADIVTVHHERDVSI
ncbi:helix-turn-helix transcriptional regulator [Arthrobacter sp. Z1-15]